MINTSCILTVIKNEQEYLDEWIRYHLDLGIDHIFIFEDIDSDSHKEITDKYKDNVTLNSVFTVLDEETQKLVKEYKINKNGNPQPIYIKNGLLYLKGLNFYDWCFVIDNDEFITLETLNDNINDTLMLFNSYDAIILQHKTYGANGLIHKPDYSNYGVIDIFDKEMCGYIPTNNKMGFTKTCYNLNTFKEDFFWYIHQPSDKCNFCRTNFERNRTKQIYDKMYIRHYITKSWEEYIWKRKTRGYFVGKIKDLNCFFNINPDMNYLKQELIAELKNEILVILPYKQSDSQGNELKLALNGWKMFCQFKYHFVVIGEFNEELINEYHWVEFIYCPQIKKVEGQYTPNLDAQHKMKVIMEKYSLLYDGFIWMNDDFYAIKPFNLNDITTIHFHSSNFIGNKNSPTYFWNHTKWKTRQLLDKENLPHINYSTHYPYYFEFKKLNEIFNKFNMLNESYVLEDIYFNYFKHEEPILDSKIRLGIWSKLIFDKDFQNAIENPNIKFVCNSVEGWSKELEKSLETIINKED